MGETAKVSVALIGTLMLFVFIIGLSTDVPLWALLVVLVIVGAITALVLFIWSRFTEEGQEDRLMVRVGSNQRGERTSRTFVYIAAAIVSLLGALPGLLNPEHGVGPEVSSLLLGAAFGCLAFQEHRRDRWRINLSETGDPLAILKPSPVRSASTNPPPMGRPRMTLVAIIIFASLLAVADIRMILGATGQDEVWIAVGQMVIWLPGAGYAAFCQIRRIKEQMGQKNGAAGGGTTGVRGTT